MLQIHGYNYITHLLTYSMVHSPSWDANWFAVSQEIPRVSQNLKVLYPTHKRLPPVSILGQPNPVHIPTSHLLQIHPIIHPSTPWSPQWSLSLRFPHQDPIHPPFLTHKRHMPSSSHSSRIINFIVGSQSIAVCIISCILKIKGLAPTLVTFQLLRNHTNKRDATNTDPRELGTQLLYVESDRMTQLVLCP